MLKVDFKKSRCFLEILILFIFEKDIFTDTNILINLARITIKINIKILEDNLSVKKECKVLFLL